MDTFEENYRTLTHMVADKCNRILTGGRNKHFSWTSDGITLSVGRRGDKWDVFIGGSNKPCSLIAAGVEAKMKAYVLLDKFNEAYRAAIADLETRVAAFIKEHQ